MTSLDRWRAADPFTASPTKIIAIVAHMYEIYPDEITGKSRRASIVRARHVACWLMRSVTGLSYPQIAEAVNRRDHTTAMHSVNKIDELMDSDPTLAGELQQLELLLGKPRQERLIA